MNATVQVPQILNISQYLKERPTEAVRTVLHQSTDMNLVLWQIPPRGSLPPHRHPSGEDIWLVLRGEADLIDDAAVGGSSFGWFPASLMVRPRSHLLLARLMTVRS